MTTTVVLQVNGVAHTLQAAADERLVDVLRETLGLRGTRLGCGEEACGSCHVLLGDRAVPSCGTPLWAAQDHPVTTVEGLPARLRRAFVAEQAAQCGFCSSGMLVAAEALLRAQPRPSADQVRVALDGHLCRCGAHPRIVRAVLRAAADVDPGRATA